MVRWLSDFEWFVLAYFLVLNSTYLVLTVLAAVEFYKYFRRVPFAGHDELFANPLTPSVSVIVPAYNEEVGIIDSVRAMLSLRFPQFEIVVVDDGSTDRTFELLHAEFDLVRVPYEKSEHAIETLGEIRSVWTPRDGSSVVVVCKDNASSRSDALNAGLNCARMDLVCMVDADSLLDPEALLRVVKPFVDDPQHVVGTGGVIRPANGCVVEQGTITSTAMPRGWLARIQVIEYLRAFLLGRTGWSTLQGMLIISGAFGMFRRELVLSLGGLDNQCMGEDCELVTRIHHHMRSTHRKDYRLVFVSEPVCWTEVPSTRVVLARQRRRWSRGLAEVLWKHKRMVFNPRYGRIGLVVLPHYLLFELLGPIVELLGVLTVFGIFALNIAGKIFDYPNWLLNTHFAWLFFVVAILYGFFLSLAAIAVEEFSFHRMSSWRDLYASLASSVIENVGYRQMHAWWRLRGLGWWLKKGQAVWGAMPRSGYQPAGTTGRVIGSPAKKRLLPADEEK
jgi:cellulose synthase/poly-beta-1,6-N-acetylglucosamine synthase-like glycosyltransferase